MSGDGIYTARAMYVLIRTSNADRISGRFESRVEAEQMWRWLVADSRAHPDTFSVQEIDGRGGYVGPAINPDPSPGPSQSA